LVYDAEHDKGWWNPVGDEWLSRDATIDDIKRAIKTTCSWAWTPSAPQRVLIDNTMMKYLYDGHGDCLYDEAETEKLKAWVKERHIDPFDIYLCRLTDAMQDEWRNLADYAYLDERINKTQLGRLKGMELFPYEGMVEVTMEEILLERPPATPVATETFTSRYDGKQLIIVYNRLTEKGYLTCSENTWLYLWGVFVHPKTRKSIDRPKEVAEWSAARGKKQALMEMIRTVMALDCSEILKKTAQWFVFSDKTTPDPKIIKSYKIKGEKSRNEFLQLVTVH